MPRDAVEIHLDRLAVKMTLSNNEAQPKREYGRRRADYVGRTCVALPGSVSIQGASTEVKLHLVCSALL